MRVVEPIPVDRGETSDELRLRITRLEAIEHGLRAQIAELRQRFLALMEALPPELLVQMGPFSSATESSALAREMFTGWVETAQLTPSDVATELRLLWQRCGRAT